MSSPKQPKGMLYVRSSPGPNVPLDEYNKWYDEDHAPLRRSVPGVLNASRYLAIDAQKPEWLAVYELEDIDVLTSAPYLAQWKAQSAYEKDILARTETLDRRVYRLTYDRRAPGYDDATEKLYTPVALAPGPDLPEKEFHAWYLEEHIPMLARVPGWLRSSRWELARDSTRPISGTKGHGEDICPYLAIHEWAGKEIFDTPEHKAATQTPWRDRIMAGIDKSVEDRRMYKVHRLWK